MPFFSRAFSFKKKSPSGTTKVEYPAKVIGSSVLANRNVNIAENSLVTKPSLTFSNKLERPQKSKINNFFPVSSKCKSESFSPAGELSSLSQTPSEKSDSKVGPAPTKPDSQGCNGSWIGSSSLDASEFPMDDWDDFDDFETPVRSKNDSFGSDKSDKITKTSSSADEEFPEFKGKQSFDKKSELDKLNDAQTCMKTDDMEERVNETVLPGPDVFQEPAEDEVQDSPVKRSRRRRPPPIVTSVLSDSDEDIIAMSEPLKENASK